jgi:hypothetical protein
MNTLEWMPTFLVPLWLCATSLSDVFAAVLGVVWIVGRAVYFAGYSRSVEKWLPGFFIQSTACLGAAAGVVIALVGRLKVGLAIPDLPAPARNAEIRTELSRFPNGYCERWSVIGRSSPSRLSARRHG